MINAGLVIGTVETNLGLLDLRSYNRPTIYNRLARCVQRLQDRESLQTERANITTEAGKGVYVLDSKYDKVQTVTWPSEWLSTTGVLPQWWYPADSPSPLPENDFVFRVGFLKPVSRNELYRFQSMIDAYGITGWPVGWTHYKDTDSNLVIEIADKKAIEAGLTIALDLLTVARAEYFEKDPIPLESWMEERLTTMLEIDMCRYAQVLAMRSDRQLVGFYASKLMELRQELVRIENEDRVNREFTENTMAKGFDHWYPPERNDA